VIDVDNGLLECFGIMNYFYGFYADIILTKTRNPEASELFKEVAYSYSVLSDPEKRRQYDTAGFEV
jgi:hypothetical protein